MDHSSVDRRTAITFAAAVLALPALTGRADAQGKLPRLGPGKPFSVDALKKYAAELAAKPFQPLRRIEAAAAIDYDALNHIHYRAEHEIWPDNPAGGVRFFPVSQLFREPIPIHVVEKGVAREVIASPDLFDMPADSTARQLTGENSGFSGFRVMSPKGVGDWIAWLGASYFRSAGPLDQYGLSARGILIDAATRKAEEFPFFRAFWLEERKGGIRVHALLDGPSIAGVWSFDTVHGADAVVQDVTARFILRKPVERLGLAPLTSMYWYGETERAARPDWRPEVHDSDGLFIINGQGEQLWRPLINPRGIEVNAFADRNPRGFGLMQRDRAYENYEDDGVFYHKRPSAWIEPVGDWGEGAVELMELPTRLEIEDNIVAFWRPANLPAPGTPFDFAYRLSWLKEMPDKAPLGRVVMTRTGPGGRPGFPPEPENTKIVVDFEGPNLVGKKRDSGIMADITLGSGEVVHSAAYPVVGRPGRFRLMMDIKPANTRMTDVRASLTQKGAQLTEIFLYQFASK